MEVRAPRNERARSRTFRGRKSRRSTLCSVTCARPCPRTRCTTHSWCARTLRQFDAPGIADAAKTGWRPHSLHCEHILERKLHCGAKGHHGASRSVGIASHDLKTSVKGACVDVSSTKSMLLLSCSGGDSSSWTALLFASRNCSGPSVDDVISTVSQCGRVSPST